MITRIASVQKVTTSQLEAIEIDLSSMVTAYLEAKGLDARVMVETYQLSPTEFDIHLNVTKRYELNRKARDYNQWAKNLGFLQSGEFFQVKLKDGGPMLVTVVALDHSHDFVMVEDEDENQYELTIDQLNEFGKCGKALEFQTDPRRQKRDLRAPDVAATVVSQQLEDATKPTVDLSW